jgi:hypothetical protein
MPPPTTEATGPKSCEVAGKASFRFPRHWLQDQASAVELIDRRYRNKTFSVPRIAETNTRGLSGQPVKWQDYGGMLALFRLSQSAMLPRVHAGGKMPSSISSRRNPTR